MNLKDYAAKQTQGTQSAADNATDYNQNPFLDMQGVRKENAILQSAYFDLRDKLRSAIDSGERPGVILQQLTGILFGDDSPQAAAVAAKVERPETLEIQLANNKAQQAAVKRKRKQQADALAATDAEIAALAAQEKDLMQRIHGTACFDGSLMEVLTFYKLQMLEVTPGALDAAQRLYNRHKDSPAALAMLHGCLLFLQQEQLAGRVQFTLPQFDQLDRLQRMTTPQ